jgi:hypothetical protein
VRRGGIIVGGLLAALLAGGAVADAESPRRHRLHLPTAELGRSLSVDEFEFALRPSKLAVAAGRVRIRVYNRGEDDHNLVVVTRDGKRHAVELQPATSGVVTPRLARGRYKLFCSLYEGTPQSHEARGMRFVLTVH